MDDYDQLLGVDQPEHGDQSLSDWLDELTYAAKAEPYSPVTSETLDLPPRPSDEAWEKGMGKVAAALERRRA